MPYQATLDGNEQYQDVEEVTALWRRIGDERLAREWFSRVPDELTHPKSQRWIVDAARQQRDNPREWFA